MKTYHLQVITGNNASDSGTYTTSCIADSYKISAGVYMFRDEDEYTVACYSGTYTTSCIADSYKISAGVYMFRDEDEYTVACYPVDRTIIYKIEYHDQIETH